MRKVFKILTIIFLLIFLLPIVIWASAQTATPSPDEIMQRVINSSFYKSIPNEEDISAVEEKISATYKAFKQQIDDYSVDHEGSDFERYRHKIIERACGVALRNIKACLAEYDFDLAYQHYFDVVDIDYTEDEKELERQFSNSVRAAAVAAYRAYLSEMTSRLKTFAKALEKQSWPLGFGTPKNPKPTINIRMVHFTRDHSNIDSITVEQLLARYLKHLNDEHEEEPISPWGAPPLYGMIQWKSQLHLPWGSPVYLVIDSGGIEETDELLRGDIQEIIGNNNNDVELCYEIRPDSLTVCRISMRPGYGYGKADVFVRIIHHMVCWHILFSPSPSVMLISKFRGPNFNRMKAIMVGVAHTLRDAFATGTEHQPEANPSIEFNPLTSVNINTSPDEKDKCNLQVIISNEKGKPVKGASVALKKPKLGKLSALNVVTDAGGQARVVYTAPTDEELEKLGKEEINVLLEATDVKTGKSSSVEIHVKSKKKKLATRIKHEILPAHPDYYNQIDFAFKAANKPDGSPYKAVITVKNSNGALVKDWGDHGGTRKLEMKVWPKNKYTFYYHWIGSTAMTKPFDEVVNIEIPELKLKKTVKFSVGIDLEIVSAQLKYNTVYPVMFEPFYIYVQDKFHPDADLLKIFKDFRIFLKLKITQVSHIPAPPNYKEEGFASALLTAWEGSSYHKHLKTVISDGGLWKVDKTKDKRYIVKAYGKDSTGKAFISYPGVNLFERGSYQFEVSMTPGKFDADPRNNHILTDRLEVSDFVSQGDEIIHTVLLPSAEFLVSSLGPWQVQLTFSSMSLYQHIKEGDGLNAIWDIFSAYNAVLQGINKKELKEVIDENSLAIYLKTLGDKEEVLFPEKKYKSKLKIKADLQNTYAKTKINKVNRIAQFALKGTKDYYLIEFTRNGIKDYDANIAGGHRLELAPPKINNQTKDYQRIREGKNSIVLAANKREKINLNLNGNGAQGEIYIITPDKIKSYKYPNRNWHSVIEVDNSGSPIVKEGSKLVKESTSINNNVNDKAKNHNPAQNEINNTSPSIGITGTWKSSFGNITFHQQGNMVTGTYTHDHGRLVGFLRDNILTGKWSEAPTYKPYNDAGIFRLTFSRNGRSFTGHWRYGFKWNTWSGTWNGEFIGK